MRDSLDKRNDHEKRVCVESELFTGRVLLVRWQVLNLEPLKTLSTKCTQRPLNDNQ